MRNKTRLSNGIVVVTEPLRFFRMVHVQIRVKAGSGAERKEEWGAAHFLEHLTFAGDPSFSSKMAEFGAMFQAKTAMDHTTYFLDVPADGLFPALGHFLDLIMRSQLEDDLVEAERSVILSELGLVDEDVFEAGLAKFYEGMAAPYGHAVIGTEESIRGLSTEVLQAFRSRFYTPDHVLVGVAGDVCHEEVVQAIERLTSMWQGTGEQACEPVLREEFARMEVESDTDVVHLLWGFRAPARQDPDRMAFAAMMKSLTGDGTDMWSHLFDLIRTKLGAAYAVGGEFVFLDQAGLYFFTVVTQLERAEEMVEIVEREFARFRNREVTLQLSRAVATLRSAIFSMEDQLPSRVMRMLEQEIYEQPFQSVEEECEMLELISEGDVWRVATEYLQPQLLVVIGPKIKV